MDGVFMNAYELADILQEYYEDFDGSFPALEKSIVMLRQQADRIAELEDRLSMYEIKDLDRGIIGKIGDCPIHDLVHRTTPQIKELSDEEINAVYHEVWNSNKWSDVEGIDIEKFARAILKKASEK
jgi:hypothetical protein